jgi:UDP-glucuronate 4-epimerase
VKYVVTGAAGFIGSHLAERLLAAGHEVVGIDSFDDFYAPERKERNLAGIADDDRFTLLRGDLIDPGLTRPALDGAEAVVHLAARAGVRPSFDDPLAYLRANVAATATLIEAVIAGEVPRFVFISSSSVYGDGAESPFREDGNTGIPRSPYAATKVAGEAMCRAFAHRIPHIAVLRLFSVYGPRQRPDLALQTFARCIASGQPIPVLGTTESFRDYTFVDDIVDGIQAVLTVDADWILLNLGSGRPVTLEDMIRQLEDALGAPAERELLPPHPGDLFGTWADISAAKSALGFNPQWSFAQGVERFTEWFRREEARFVEAPPPGPV